MSYSYSISLFFSSENGDTNSETSETNETPAERRTSDEILNKYCSPLKSTEIFKDITGNDNKKPPVNEEKENQQRQPRKISFTTEKTIMVNVNANDQPTKKADQAKFRKVSIDINYVYDQQQGSNPSRMNIHDEKLNDTDNDSGTSKVIFQLPCLSNIHPSSLVCPWSVTVIPHA